jgi:hypothetical protein
MHEPPWAGLWRYRLAPTTRSPPAGFARLRFALGPPKSACRYSMPADQLDAKYPLKARVKSGVGVRS